MDDIKHIIDRALEKIKSADFAALEDIKIRYLGKNGVLTQILKSLSQYSIEDKKIIGPEANRAKDIIVNEIEKRKKDLRKVLLDEKMQKEKLDYSPSFYFPFSEGSFHPVVQTIKNISSVFKSLGFRVVEGPEIETDWYNFEALNIPESHPSRDTQDTFYIEGMKNLLRTHTSPVQIHVMEKQSPPVKVIVPGRVYRNEASDASHSSTFHQIEGFEVDENISFVDLKAVLINFIHKFFGSELGVRFRPSHFQFTEPSAEVDIQCFFCKGRGCRICKNSGWIETLGCGIVHPDVLKAVNYDSEKYTGYAFGIGVERITMLKYGIDDIRLLYENDLRFLKQF
ncbi:phenylalanine--tRNA ligase subunit alpha [Candidatus Endomicrobiellum trichonymphae]|uniref:Phenylalanine--tRNA ligase alpha subunit n=1 Tax=Endomicrobium trichonymphae TaxID=1408204 RepID=A0A1E5IKW1_ENDTX|nr:phenylalanine--tRNA ligase subunit alpha [Candidatus Endomicrobium trichonymphae]